MHKYCAFDIEIARVIPEGVEDWKAMRPLGISCAATLTAEGKLTHWYGGQPGDQPGERMNRLEAGELVAYLQAQVAAGYTILTWNGLGFDFDILAEESGLLDACTALANEHVDMMFHLFCMKGYPLALDKAAKGMGLPGKTPGMTGDLAPRYWQEGKRQEVLQYVAQDVRTTLDVSSATEKWGQLNWISNTGKPQFVKIPQGWYRVKEALLLPEPDVSWMKNPMQRKGFTKWQN
jgi:Predicted 3'-5' exonuclease related to the exonuclease domain of PolB